MGEAVSYKEIFESVKQWLPQVIEDVKKDLKSEHLKKDRHFCKRYFMGKSAAHVTVEEMSEAYYKDVTSGNVSLGEFIASRWVLKHTDIYELFEAHLSKVQEDFEKIDEIANDLAQKLAEVSTKQFGALKTYLFAKLNFVAFPSQIFEGLLKDAEKQLKAVSKKSSENKENIDELKQRYAKQFLALEQKYERKFSGMERKYLRDMSSLKKQISNLQKKMSNV